MGQFELSPETRAVLDRIRHSGKFLSIFEMPSDLAEAAVWEIGKIVLEDKGLPLVQQQGYRWYLSELSKLLRTKTEWDLALEMEICLRKWVSYSLDSALLQMLLCECYSRIGAMTPQEIEENPKDEVRMTNEARSSNESPRKHETTRNEPEPTSADYADSADCVPEAGSNNEERCTMNEQTTPGGTRA
jgi:hypothetical protein